MPRPRHFAPLVVAVLVGLPSAALASDQGGAASARPTAVTATAPKARTAQGGGALTPGPPGSKRRRGSGGRSRTHRRTRRGTTRSHTRPSKPARRSRPSGRRPSRRAPGGLAKTGFDLSWVVLLGLGLLVSGIGLRLRTAGVRPF